MKKGLIGLIIIILSVVVSGQEEPEVDFTELECNNLGVLSFKVDYVWTGYKGGDVYLKGVKVSAIKDGETIPIEGYWRKFKTEDFPQSEIKLNSPTAFFFSEENSLSEGAYTIEVDYTVRKKNIIRFKDKFSGSVSCPKQKEVIKETEALPEEKKIEEVKEEPKTVSVKEPPLFSEESKNYNIYCIIGLLVLISIITIFVMKKLPKHHYRKRKNISKNMAKLFERKRT